MKKGEEYNFGLCNFPFSTTSLPTELLSEVRDGKREGQLETREAKDRNKDMDVIGTQGLS